MRLTFLATVREFYLPNIFIDSYSREGLWKHSVAVGFVSAMVARTCGLPIQHDAFLSGALHDFGLLVLDNLSPRTFAELIAEIDESTVETDLELGLFGANHTDVGGLILNNWGIPSSVVNAVRFHNRPLDAIDNEDSDTVCCVAIANYLCSRSGCTALGVHNVKPPSGEVLSHIGIDETTLKMIWANLQSALVETESIC